MKTLEEYKKKCPGHWEGWIGYKLVMVLYFNKEGLRRDELKALSQLNESEFQKGLEGTIDGKDIIFKEDAKERKYSISSKLREVLDKFYES